MRTIVNRPPAASPATPGRRKRAPKLPMPMEHESQVAFFERVDGDPRTHHLPIYAVPNGGHRHPATAARLKREGVRAGVPDICVDVPRYYGVPTVAHGLRIEMKRKPNKPTPGQLEWIEMLRAHGYVVDVCYSAAEAWTRLCDYLDIPEVPTR